MYWRNYMLICLSLLQLCNKKYRALCRIRIKNHLWINWSLLPGSSLVAGSCQRRETKASRRLLQKDNSRWQESISVTPNQERTNTSQFRLLQRRHCLSELLLFLFHMLLWNLASVLKTHIKVWVYHFCQTIGFIKISLLFSKLIALYNFLGRKRREGRRCSAFLPGDRMPVHCSKPCSTKFRLDTRKNLLMGSQTLEQTSWKSGWWPPDCPCLRGIWIMLLMYASSLDQS